MSTPRAPRLIPLLLLGLLLLFRGSEAAYAAEDAQIITLRGGVFVNPPFVIKHQDGTFTGMVVDLWDLIDDRLETTLDLIEYQSMDALIRATIMGEVDLILTNLIVTHERAESLKLTYPWYDTGLKIMVDTKSKTSIIDELQKNGRLNAYLIIFLLIASMTLALTLFRRKIDPEFPKNWVEGLSMSLYHLIVAAKSGRFETKHIGWIGYILSTAWMIFGVALIAYVTSTVTSAMTTVSLTNDIASFRDLPGKTVGVIAGSAEGRYLRQSYIGTVEFEHIEEAIKALGADAVDAIVTDAPVLEYWVHRNPQLNMQIVGPLFYPAKFALATNFAHSELADRISIRIIELQEQGILSELKAKYFGSY